MEHIPSKHSAKNINKIDPRITQETSREFIIELYREYKEQTRKDSFRVLFSESQKEEHLVQRKLAILDALFKEKKFEKLPISNDHISYVLADGVIIMCYPEEIFPEHLKTKMHFEMFFMKDNGKMIKISPTDTKEQFATNQGFYVPIQNIEHTFSQSLFSHIIHLYSRGDHCPITDEHYKVWKSQTHYRALFEFASRVRRHAIDRSKNLGEYMTKENLVNYLCEQECKIFLMGNGLIAAENISNSNHTYGVRYIFQS